MPIPRKNGSQTRLWCLSPRRPGFRAGGQALATGGVVPLVVAADGSPWDGFTQRIPNFWGWVILLAVVAIAAGLVTGGLRRWKKRTRYQRVMPLHWRLRLRRHPGHGFASLRELVEEYGLAEARKEARRLFPRMTAGAGRLRNRVPATSAAARLGRAPNFPFKTVWAPPEETILYVAPPRSGKSGEVANQVLDAPGACVVTSSRRDIVDLTASLRSRMGPVLAFDPQTTLGLASPWAEVIWSPVHACEDPSIAMFRARSLVSMMGTDDVKGGSFWADSAARTLRILLHAAAVGEYSMADVGRWVATNSDAPVQVLRANADQAAPGWADELAKIVSLGDDARETHQSLAMTLGNVLDFLSHPGLLTTCGGPGRNAGFDVETFIEQGGTLYMLAAQGDEGRLVAPVFSALAEEIFARGVAYAQRRGEQRLDPPLTLVLDEAPTICPVPLPAWSATASGSGIRLIAAAQTLSQLVNRWDQAGASTILSNMTTKVVWGGLAVKEEREAVSALAGDAEFWKEPLSVWTDSHGNRHEERHREREREPIIRPDELRRLRKRHALVISRTAAPTIVRTRAAWLRRSVKLALRRPLPHRQEAAPAAQPFTSTAPDRAGFAGTGAGGIESGSGDTAPQPVVATGPAEAVTSSAQSPNPPQPADDQSMKLSDEDFARLLDSEDPARGAQNGPASELGHGWGPPPSSTGGGLPEPPWGRRDSYPWERRDGDA